MNKRAILIGVATLFLTAFFGFFAQQVIQNISRQQSIQVLNNELSNAQEIITSQRYLEVQNEQYNQLIRSIVSALASNDKEYGIGGVEADVPAYTNIEVLRAIRDEVEGRSPDVWINNVGRFFSDRTDYFEEVPDVWPITREYVGRVTSGFGFRNSPFGGQMHFHGGVDISAEKGTPVIATADGTISGVWYRHPTFGLIVYIDHENGFQTRYAHLDDIVVEYQQEIRKGDIVGYIGDSGRSQGVHLHYEIRKNGEPMDPVKFWLLYY